jgi:hypothetical protein
MKLSNERILNDIKTLAEISAKQLPVKVSYAIAKNISKIEVELKIYNHEREKLIEKYAEKDDKDKIIADAKGQIKFKKEHLADWNKDIRDLLTIENDIDIHKFSLDALEGYNMSPGELRTIDYMLETK